MKSFISTDILPKEEKVRSFNVRNTDVSALLNCDFDSQCNKLLDYLNQTITVNNDIISHLVDVSDVFEVRPSFNIVNDVTNGPQFFRTNMLKIDESANEEFDLLYDNWNDTFGDRTASCVSSSPDDNDAPDDTEAYNLASQIAFKAGMYDFQLEEGLRIEARVCAGPEAQPDYRRTVLAKDSQGNRYIAKFLLPSNFELNQVNLDNVIKMSVPTIDFVKRQLNNLSILELFSQATGEVLAFKDSFSISNLSSWASKAVASVNSVLDPYIKGISEHFTFNGGVSGVINYIKEVIAHMGQMTATSDGIQFTNADDFSGFDLLSGFVSGIVTVTSTLVSMIGIAIGGVVGIAMTAIGVIANGINAITNRVDVLQGYTRWRHDRYTNDIFPIGIFQSNFNLPAILGRSTQFNQISDYTAGARIDLPGGFVIINNQGYFQMFLRSNCNVFPDKELINITDTKLSISCTAQDVYDDWALAISQSDNVEYILLDDAELDNELKVRFVCNLLWFLYANLATSRQGVNGYWNCDDPVNKVFLENLFGLLADYEAGNLTPFVIKNTYTWSDLTGNGNSYLSRLIKNLMGSDWWQFNDTTSMLPNSSTPLDYWKSNLSDIFNYHWSTEPMYGVYGIPVSGIYVNTFNATKFWVQFSLVIAAVTITAVAASVVACKTRQRVRRATAKRQAAVESAWSQYTNNKSDENYNAYKKAVRKNNRLAKLTGGTTYSYVNYWQTTDTSSVSSIDQLGNLLFGDEEVEQPLDQLVLSVKHLIYNPEQ